MTNDPRRKRVMEKFNKQTEEETKRGSPLHEQVMGEAFSWHSSPPRRDQQSGWRNPANKGFMGPNADDDTSVTR